MALNGGPNFNFTEAFSFLIPCESEIVATTGASSSKAAGRSSAEAQGPMGLTSQILPRRFFELIKGPDQANVLRAMFQVVRAGEGLWRRLLTGPCAAKIRIGV